MLERHLAGKGEDELVFTTTDGIPLQHASFQTHAWKKALAVAFDHGWTEARAAVGVA
jgi:hypothetical protein